MTNKIILDGREVKVGDRMWSAVSGHGDVTAIHTGCYPICFRSCRFGFANYCFDGALYKGGPRCLFWDEPKFDPPPPPKRKVKKWQWLYRSKGFQKWVLTYHFRTSEDALKWLNTSLDYELGPRVDATEIEVEE